MDMGEIGNRMMSEQARLGHVERAKEQRHHCFACDILQPMFMRKLVNSFFF